MSYALKYLYTLFKIKLNISRCPRNKNNVNFSQLVYSKFTCKYI